MSLGTLLEAGAAAAAVVAVFALLVVLGGAGARRRRFIAGYRFPDGLAERLAGRLPDLTGTQRAQVLTGLRQWLLVCHDEQAAGRTAVLPSRAVEVAWSEFAALEDAYDAFCRKAFGGMLHPLPGTEQSAPLGPAMALTLEAAGRETGEAVPLLFRIDSELGLPDGHRYDAVRLEHLRLAAADLRDRDRRAG